PKREDPDRIITHQAHIQGPDQGGAEAADHRQPQVAGNRRKEPGQAMSTATVEAPLESPIGSRVHYLNVNYGIRSWLFTTDHKRIALLYLASITFFFFIGGAAAVLMRLHLIEPQGA